MNRTIVLVVKDNFQTRFMQDADLFEPFKFVGRLVEGKQTPSHHHLTALDVLQRTPSDDKNFTLVGVIIPNVDAAFLPKHTVYSNGTGWMTVEDLCKNYNVEMELPCT